MAVSPQGKHSLYRLAPPLERYVWACRVHRSSFCSLWDRLGTRPRKSIIGMRSCIRQSTGQRSCLAHIKFVTHTFGCSTPLPPSLVEPDSHTKSRLSCESLAPRDYLPPCTLADTGLASHTLRRERKGLVTLQLPSCHQGMQLLTIAVR